MRRRLVFFLIVLTLVLLLFVNYLSSALGS